MDRFQSVAVQIAEGSKIWLLKNEMLKSGVRCEANTPIVFEIGFLYVLKISELIKIASLRVGVSAKIGCGRGADGWSGRVNLGDRGAIQESIILLVKQGLCRYSFRSMDMLGGCMHQDRPLQFLNPSLKPSDLFRLATYFVYEKFHIWRCGCFG